MKNEELKEAIAKYIESKELVLMGYSPEYIDDVKADMEIAFRAGANWMAEQGETFKEVPVYIAYADKKEICITVAVEGTSLESLENDDEVIVQIRKKQ